MPPLERRRLRVRGVVQGVGFRPFVYRLATGYDLTGFVLNDGDGVVIEAEGDAASLDGFVGALRDQAPPLARIGAVVAERLKVRGDEQFAIAASVRGRSVGAAVPPDVAICEDCVRELFDPSDRRYRYPFVNCTQCGPRFTIVRAAPYDRANTTMAGFAMCAACRREYDDPNDRRFHAEPIACPACGPQLSMPIHQAVSLLKAGAILAVKGLGGYHLACDAGADEVVSRLRARKHREEKPFALMTTAPADLCSVSSEEWSLLRSPERPIVLLRRRADAAIADAVAPGSPWLGVMLPYTPLHHLLAADFGGALVLTSGNLSDEPIAFEDEDAQARLGGVADAFLTHDRAIHRRCEDSIHHRGFVIRRSRGYAPAPLPTPRAARSVVATGAELKSTFCVTRLGEAFLSPHLGDLDSSSAFKAFRADLELYLAMLDIEPELIAHDLHPEYLSTKWAFEQDVELVGVQHHHAHAAACLAEHREEGPALALVFDGTGYGTDGLLWGSELLRCDLTGFERLAHLEPVPLPGGEASIREPWRMAAVHLERAEIAVPWPRWELVRESLKLPHPLASGMGRLFDAVAAILGVCEHTSYEGQAAVGLEYLAGTGSAEPYSWDFGDGTGLVATCYSELRAGRPLEEIAARFHETVAAGAAAACAEAAGPRLVVLSGGSFQNLRLLESTRHRLEELGFRVLSHRHVPPNDGGISYGQAAVAARRSNTCA